MKSIEKSAKSGPKKDLFKFESVNTLMGHTVLVSIQFIDLECTYRRKTHDNALKTGKVNNAILILYFHLNSMNFLNLSKQKY